MFGLTLSGHTCLPVFGHSPSRHPSSASSTSSLLHFSRFSFIAAELVIPNFSSSRSRDFRSGALLNQIVPPPYFSLMSFLMSVPSSCTRLRSSSFVFLLSSREKVFLHFFPPVGPAIKSFWPSLFDAQSIISIFPPIWSFWLVRLICGWVCQFWLIFSLLNWLVRLGWSSLQSKTSVYGFLMCSATHETQIRTHCVCLCLLTVENCNNLTIPTDSFVFFSTQTHLSTFSRFFTLFVDLARTRYLDISKEAVCCLLRLRILASGLARAPAPAHHVISSLILRFYIFNLQRHRIQPKSACCSRRHVRLWVCVCVSDLAD